QYLAEMNASTSTRQSLTKRTRTSPTSKNASSWVLRTFTTENSHATKKAFSPTSAAIAASFPTINIGGSQCDGTFSASQAPANKNSTGVFISRMRILASGTGSLVIYQLDLVTPGINPCEASSRKVSRDILNRRMKARLRPLTSQRFTTRVGLASRGSCVKPA